MGAEIIDSRFGLGFFSVRFFFIVISLQSILWCREIGPGRSSGAEQ